ncbi:PIN domain-containing protein [Methylobacterium sp. P5_C11]
MRFFPDSNFFFQCRDSKEIDWSSVTEDDLIELFLARTIQQEIDKHKAGGNSRRADRARRVNAQIRSTLLSPDKFFVLRESNPRVLMRLAPRLNPERWKNSHLDLSQPDDRLVDEALSFQVEQPELPAALLTNDTPAMVTAHHVGLRYIPIPDEWLLPPEPNATEKKIAGLERRLADLEKSVPVLVLSTLSETGSAVGRLDLSMSQYDSLTKDQIAHLMMQLELSFPMKRDFPGPQRQDTSDNAFGDRYAGIIGRTVWHHPLEQHIAQYKENYSRWKISTKSALESFHEFLNATNDSGRFAVRLANDGARPAEDLVVTFECAGSITLDLIRETEITSSGLSAPPAPPEGAYGPASGLGAEFFNMARMVSRFDGIDSLLGSPSRRIAGPPPKPDEDPYAFFFYQKHRIPSDSWELRCTQFRHQLEPKEFRWKVVAKSGPGEAKGVIRIRASASNVSTPVMFNLPVRLERRAVSTYDEARAALDPMVLNGQSTLK